MADPIGRSVYESWVRDHSAGLYRCAYRLSGRADVAEELVQDTFVEAWRSIKSLRDAASARGWLMAILRHRYARWVRDEARRPSSGGAVGGPASIENLPSAAPTPGEALGQRDWLQAGLDSLDDRFKLPLIMVFMEGLSCEEAARALELPVGTVLSRLYRARQKLRECLTADGAYETT